MSQIAASLIRLLHICFIFVMIITPFIPKINWLLLVMYICTSVTLLIHWAANDDTCALTYIESYIRGVPLHNSFMYDLVSPVYKISDETLRKTVTYGTVALTLFSLYRLYVNKDSIQRDTTVIRNRFLQGERR